jgi:alkaline phosphatase D
LQNPHIKYFDGDSGGYVRCRVTPERWRTELRMATGVGARVAGQYTHATFEIEDGVPGAVRVS